MNAKIRPVGRNTNRILRRGFLSCIYLIVVQALHTEHAQSYFDYGFNPLPTSRYILGASADGQPDDNSSANSSIGYLHLHHRWRRYEIYPLLKESHLIVENSFVKKKESLPRASTNRNQEKIKHPISLQVKSHYALATAGVRFIPTRISSYLEDSRRYTYWHDTPSGRSANTFFIQPLPSMNAIGVYALQNSKKTGWFFNDEKDRLFAAYHPKDRSGAFAVRAGSRRKNREWLYLLDSTYKRKEREGYSSGFINRPTFLVQFGGERKLAWDKSTLKGDKPANIKNGKSGLVHASSVIRHRYTLESAGLDRAGESYRMIRAGYIFANKQSCENLPLTGWDKLSGLQFRVGSLASSTLERNIQNTQYLSRTQTFTGGAGWSSNAKSFYEQAVYESGLTMPSRSRFDIWIDAAPHRTSTLEMQLIQRTAYFKISASLIGVMGKDFEKNIMYIDTAQERGSGSRFLSGTKGAFYTKIEMPYLYLYLEVRERNKKRESYAALQGRMIW